MAKRKRHIPHIRSKHRPQQTRSTFILLDQFSIADIHKWTAFKDQFLKYYWDYYNELAYQRSQIADEIKKSLLEAAQKTFSFEKWQRAVKYKYTLEPFSVTGSLTDTAGGRFNMGDINPSQFPSFPALYLASDKNTAHQESLCQKFESGQENRALDFALTDPSSVANISLSGVLDSIINLKEPEKLQPFVDLIKDFSIPDYLKKTAKSIGEREPELVRTVPKLMDSLLDPNWRLWPIQFDVPVASQIFGHWFRKRGLKEFYTLQNLLAKTVSSFTRKILKKGRLFKWMTRRRQKSKYADWMSRLGIKLKRQAHNISISF